MNTNHGEQVTTGKISPSVLHMVRTSYMFLLQEAFNQSNDELDRFVDYFNKNNKFKVSMEVIDSTIGKTLQIIGMPANVSALFVDLLCDDETHKLLGYQTPWLYNMYLVYGIKHLFFYNELDLVRTEIVRNTIQEAFPELMRELNK